MYRVCIQDVSSIIHARYIHDTYPDVNTTAIHARYVRYIAFRTPKFGIHCDTSRYIWIHPTIHMYRPRNSSPALPDRFRIAFFAYLVGCLRALWGLPPVDGPASSAASGGGFSGASTIRAPNRVAVCRGIGLGIKYYTEHGLAGRIPGWLGGTQKHEAPRLRA